MIIPSIGITTDEILANALLFFVAGYDTTATSLSFFMYNMARYPDIQDKLMEEINTVVGDKVRAFVEYLMLEVWFRCDISIQQEIYMSEIFK